MVQIDQQKKKKKTNLVTQKYRMCSAFWTGKENEFEKIFQYKET